MTKYTLLLAAVVAPIIIHAQSVEPTADSAKVLNEVTVQAYVYDRPINEVPAAVAVVNTKELERFSNTSILPVVNTIPGVRMEERSPGSYRFSIRGSLLRSPFGVRNVKMYWNGLPLTDGGGNTYLNLVDFNAITTAEIVKGPGSSLYGASTGGVMLINTKLVAEPQLQVSSVFGSYGLQRYQVLGAVGSEKVKVSLQYAHQQADGYREQTAMRRDAFNTNIGFTLNPKSTLTASLFYTDLFYQTPGGLTKAQYEQDPSMARPTVTPPNGNPILGAVDQQAAVYNKTFYGGLTHEYQWNDHWSTQLGVYGSTTDFKNPTIRNYEVRDEDNVGARLTTQYAFGKEAWQGKLVFGGEYQHFFSPITVSGNNRGTPTTLQTDDELKSNQLLMFAQADVELPHDFFVTLGGSVNLLKYGYLSKITQPYTTQTRKFDPVLSPRLAVLKKLTPALSLYGSISKGFSPPTLAEVRPSTNLYNNDLNPEHGTSYEAGVRGVAFGQRLRADFTVYDFRLDETIVIQRTADGADYFVNAGKTSQRGIEATMSYSPAVSPTALVNALRFWGSYTYNHYRFEDYVTAGENYSGNRLTGVAPTIGLLGVDVSVYKFYLNVTASYTDAIPLNDANSEYADEYVLLGARAGFKTSFGNRVPFEVFVGVDNALDKTYSLGNDLNAVGGRYYNAAAPRNYYGGVSVKPFVKKS